MITETGASCVFCAAHTNPDGQVHGHSYEVTAWFSRREVLSAQRELAALLSEVDHGVLPARLSLAEDLAAWVLVSLPECVAVEVRRPLEGVHARVRR